MQILYGLRHPRIVSLLDVIEETDHLFLVMEMVRGGELFDYIVSRGTLGEPGARNIFLQITEALKYVHSKDIVYRDLKPENILIVESERDETKIQIKLSDFGHSKLINDGYSTALTRVGTPQYWAPEVSDHRLAAGGYTQSVDLWSLGVVLYVMLMGSYPFDGVREPIERQIQNPQLCFTSAITGRVPSRAAQELMCSLIKVRAKDRLPLDGCLKHAWVTAGPASDRAADVGQAGGSPTEYCVMQLSARPSRNQRNQMGKDLMFFQKKFHCFAQVRPHGVVADLSGLTPAMAAEAKRDLSGIVRHNLGIVPTECTTSSLAGDGGARGKLSTVDEGPARFTLHTTTLNVGQDGAGIDLIPETGGMRVEGICPQPGQPGLRVHDLITKINEVPLVGNPETVEDIFGTYFGAGVQISVKRSAA
eukprot:TRINITY_DN18991_c0_g1_i1.p1 TRINITY_DN18991_c0_g1~~TRINITY_DN18991_c0_g1_i1.p1  ORF type:complete len:420 (-),score=65.51 TRINITY_DN18991_c0_g1_i1:25-1284(-)